jgi:hypothetical protein
VPTGKARVAAAALVIGLIAALAACGGSSSDGAAPPALGRGHGELEPGTHTLDLMARIHYEGGLAHLPKIAITVPPGWFNFDGWAMSKGPEVSSVFVTFWDVDRVYPTPCNWKYKPMVDPGRGVHGLASALAKQPRRKATAPAEAELAGFRGMYVEWSVPTDVDFDDCDEGVFESWTARGWASDRYQQAPGQVDRIWILDVNGARLLIDASYFPEATSHDRAELETVVDSIRFLD